MIGVTVVAAVHVQTDIAGPGACRNREGVAVLGLSIAVLGALTKTVNVLLVRVEYDDVVGTVLILRPELVVHGSDDKRVLIGTTAGQPIAPEVHTGQLVYIAKVDLHIGALSITVRAELGIVTRIRIGVVAVDRKVHRAILPLRGICIVIGPSSLNLLALGDVSLRSIRQQPVVHGLDLVVAESAVVDLCRRLVVRLVERTASEQDVARRQLVAVVLGIVLGGGTLAVNVYLEVAVVLANASDGMLATIVHSNL